MTNREKALELLKKEEWQEICFAPDTYIAKCPFCRRTKEVGHTYNCRLAQALALLEAEEEPIEKCRWEYDAFYGVFKTGCDNIYEFIEDGPIENRQKFCGYCGKEIEVIKVADDEVKDE